MRKHILTREEKVALKLKQIVDSLDIDLEMVGFYFAKNTGKVHYNRLGIIYEVAMEVKETDKMSVDRSII